MPQPQPRQQSRLNDIQMLQRQMMFKKLQELQRQQQFQEFGDVRQHNYVNQQYGINKNNFGDQYAPLINGTPASDASQRYMTSNINLMHHGAPPVVQGFSNGIAFSQSRGQASHSMGLVSPQVDASLYGTPVPGAGNNLGQYSQLLGASHGSQNTFEKGNHNQQDRPLKQFSTYNNSEGSNHYVASSNQIDMPEGALVGEEFQVKKLFGQVATEALNENFQQVNTGERCASAMEVGERHEQSGRTGQFPGTERNMGPLQDLCSLDPLEQKILFNTDDNSWNASFGSCSNTTSGVFRNNIENTDHMSDFPSVQSGSWSALMQSAVAETSNSDAGVQEEWSGSSFQNSELSTDNQPFNFMESGKKHPDWVQKNFQNASALSSKSEVDYKNLKTNSSFPGFQNPGTQFMFKPRDEIHSEHLETDAYQDSISMYTNGTQSGNVTESAERDSKSPWKNLDNHDPGSYSTSVGGLEQVTSGNFSSNHLISKSNQHLYVNHTDIEDGRAENKGNNEYGQSNSPQISKHAYNGASRTYEEQKCVERENSNDSYYSNASQHNITGDDSKENVWQHKYNYRHIADSNERPSGQLPHQQIPQGSRGYELGQFMFNSNVSSNDQHLEKRHIPDIHRNLTENVSPRDHDNTSAFLDTPVLCGPNMTAPRSQPHSTTFSEMPQAGSPNAFATKSYNNKFPSEAVGLRLFSPSQQTPMTNCLDPSNSSPNVARNGGIIAPEATVRSFGSGRDTSTNSYGQQLPVLEANPTNHPFLMSGLSEQDRFPMIWKNAPVRQDNDFEPASVAPHELHKGSNYKGQNESGKCSTSSESLGFSGDQAPKGASGQLESSGTLNSVSRKDKTKLSYGQDFVAKDLFETNTLDPGSVMTSSNQQRSDWTQLNANQSRVSNLEIFGHSLQPSHLSSQNYSFHQQVHLANKSHHESGLNVQQSPAYMGQQLYGDPLGIRDAVNNEMKPMLQTTLHPAGEEKNLSQPLLQNANQETVASGQYSLPGVSGATEQSQISLQMGPSCFKHYGALRNGQMLPIFDPRGTLQDNPGKMLENLHMNNSRIHLNSSGTGQENSVCLTAANNMVAVDSSTPSRVLPPDVLIRNSEILRPRKRKFAAFELLPWHKEASQGSHRFHNFSLLDLEWAHATNRLIEKMEEEAENFDDLPVLQPKRRLTLTTQLMQHVLRPAPAIIFRGDATSKYETLVYYAARLALGDACCLNNTSRMPHDISDMSSVKSKTPAREESELVVEDFLTRLKKLEADFLILGKSASISEVRVESQELEKFSMINHFAKFHSRAPAGAAEASTSSGLKRVFLQKYVKAAPMPRTVPERAQCLSL